MKTPHVSWWASGALYLVTLLLLGGVLGLAVVTRILPASSNMGWDRLADALAGTLVGGVSGFVLAMFTLRYFGPAQRCKLAAIALLGAVLALAFMHVASPPAYSTASTLPGFMMPFGSSVSLS